MINYRWILKDLFGYTDEELVNMSDNECKGKAIGLSEKVEWAEFFGEKAGRLNIFLQERVTGRAGDNVIDVAMDYIRYLEKELNIK